MTQTTQNLQRLTTEYIDREDRIRLAGEVEDGAPVVVWLTRRLLERLLPVLLGWLEERSATLPRAEALLGFAQQAAAAELTPQAPVRADAGSAQWLALAVDVVQSEKAVGLTFRGADERSATLTLTGKPLRQWLGIVHDAYLKAGWGLEAWPEWLRESRLPAGAAHAVLH